ncbi:MAG: hypothetical protein ACQEUY_10300 [Pseudomonadota bacterium]
MTRTARKEPISEEQAAAIIISGWRVIDVTPPDAPKEIFRHDRKPETIEAARRFEAEASNESGPDLDDTHGDDASQTNAGKGDA